MCCQSIIQDALELLDLDPERRHPGLRLDPTAIPIELASLVGDTCDVDYLMGQNMPVSRFARMWGELIVTGEAELADLQAGEIPGPRRGPGVARIRFERYRPEVYRRL